MSSLTLPGTSLPLIPAEAHPPAQDGPLHASVCVNPAILHTGSASSTPDLCGHPRPPTAWLHALLLLPGNSSLFHLLSCVLYGRPMGQRRRALRGWFCT